MVKCGKKCKAIGEVSVIEIGVRTRSRSVRALPMAEAKTSKKRRVASSTTPSTSELQFSSSLVNLRSRRGVVRTPERKSSPAISENSGGVCSNSDHSRCSSNGSSQLVNSTSLRSGAADLEEGFDCQDINSSSYCLLFHQRENRREMTPSSELRTTELYDLESTRKTSSMVANSQRSIADETPSQAEIDEFFSFAERVETKRFADKYNFDVVKDSPMEGRYDWVRLKP